MDCHWLRSATPDGAAVVALVSARIWGEPEPLPEGEILAVLDGPSLAGAVIYNNFSRRYGTIEMTAASFTKRWLTRPVLLEMFAYPFDQIGCQAAVLRCDPADAALSRILTAYGSKRYEIPRLRGRDKAEAIFVLGDDGWRRNGFHKENADGQKRT